LPLRDRTITAWAGGPRAIALDGLPARVRIERARDEFGAMFGADRRRAPRIRSGRHARLVGRPVCVRRLQLRRRRAAAMRAPQLATPLDETLFFAGEATAAGGQGGTVSGAFESGMRAAREARRR
jgi:hypothetical protein